jgi:hypothetical protein
MPLIKGKDVVGLYYYIVRAFKLVEVLNSQCPFNIIQDNSIYGFFLLDNPTTSLI